MYFSYNSNIKCISSAIKCIGFESIHYDINLNVVSFFIFLVILILCFYRYITNLNQ